MATKRKGDGPVKRARKVMTLEQKVEVLDRLERGESAASVGRYFQINESSVRSIKRSQAAIRASVEASTPKSAKVTHKSRDPCIEKAEKALSLWIEDMTQRQVTLTSTMIRETMKRFYNHFLDATSDGVAIDSTTGTPAITPAGFQASKGWFENFKKRSNLFHTKNVDESVSADRIAAAAFSDDLKKLIDEKGYLPQQVFNADETGLFWKRMPDKTFISINERSAPGFKAAKDRLTLLLCANASGDFMVKPMLVYRAPNPRALKGKNKNHLPVYWKSNPKAWVTARLFLDWINNCFVHDVERYLIRQNLEFKVLLILDSAPSHPIEELMNVHPNIEVIFLPLNISSQLQPLDQGVIKCFKAYYTRHVFSNIIEAMDTDPSLTVASCWKRYTITDCIKNIKDSLEELEPSAINACWQRLWGEMVSYFVGFPTVDAEVRKILELARSLGGDGFKDLDKNDIEELFNAHSQELSEEDTEELNKMNEDDVEEESEQHPKQPTFTLKVLNEALQMARNAAELLVEMDPFMERSLEFKKGLEGLLLPYKEVQKDLQWKMKQSSTN